MTIHRMKLNATPFMMMARGEKTIESRLYDEKRQKVAIGDTIIFTLISDEHQTLTVQVLGLLRYATFENMFNQTDPKKFGGNNAAELTKALEKYYTSEDQTRYGVLGIEIQRL